jgi:RND family efflux transporter MFP subunit
VSQTRVVAPDEGVISARTATLGSLTQPGQELFRLIRQNRLEWRAEVTAEELTRIQPGHMATITLADGATTAGRVRISAPTVDPQTRIGLVYVDLPSGSPARPGTFARGVFDLGHSSAITLPQSALLFRDGFTYVFRLEGTEYVAQTKVTTGRRVDDRVEILEGLNPQDRVVAGGVGFLADGDVVRVVDPATSEAASAAR